MPMDDTDHDLGEPTPGPRSRDNRDDRDYTTPGRVAERVARNELPRSEGAQPDEHPEDRRPSAADAQDPDAGDGR
jgi:hypothetical protein